MNQNDNLFIIINIRGTHNEMDIVFYGIKNLIHKSAIINFCRDEHFCYIYF